VVDEANGRVFRNEFTVECGPASDAVRSTGRWQLMKTGSCVDYGWM
jgi:hypothetical protein